MMGRFFLFFLIYVLYCFTSMAQVLNLPQFFTPRAQVSVDFSTSKNSSLLTNSSSFLIPVRTKAGIETNFKGVKNIKDLKGAVKVNFSQLMARVSYRKSILKEYEEETVHDKLNIAFTGVQYRKKFRFLLYQGAVNYYRTQHSEKDGFSYSGLVAWVRVLSLRDVVYYGGLGVYNGGNRFVLPLIGWQHKWNKKYSFSILFPSNAKLTYKLSRKLKLDAMTYTYTLRSQYYFENVDYRMQLFQLRSGLQVRWMPTKKVNVFGEIGLAYAASRNTWGEGGAIITEKLPKQSFAKVTLFYSFGKSLFNSGVLDIGIE